jgi:putative ABC transport system permease protein
MGMSDWWDRLPGETWKIALQALLAHKLRAALSTIGVVIGSASVVLVVTVGLTGGRYVMAQIEGVGSNLVYAELMRTGAPQPGTLSDEITVADMNAVAALPGVVAVGGSRAMPMAITISAAAHAVTLIGVTDGFQEIRRLLVVRGRYFDRDELASAPKVCLVTEQLARLVSPETDPLGIVMRVGDLPLTIIGIFKERISTFGQSEVERESVLVPFRVVRTLTGTEYIRTLYARAADPGAVPEVTRALADVLRDRHRRGARYQVENLTGLLSAAQNISAALTISLLMVAAISLVVSGIGIMNVMLVTVTERTREIGIRKAAGAPRQTIAAQFLIEAAMISGVGAVVGVVLAIVALRLTAPLLPADLPLPISGLSIVAALAGSASVGIVFGYLPAKRAAELQPVDALRYE